MMLGWKKKHNEIPRLKGVSKIQPLNGLSRDNKYYVKSSKGQEMILVLGNASAQYRMKESINWIKYLEACDLPTNRLLDFGTYDSGQGYYMILSWIPGTNAQELLKSGSPQICSLLGKKSGELLRKIHDVPAGFKVPYRATLSEEIGACIAEYSEDDVLFKKYPATEIFIRFLDNNKDFFSESIEPKLLHGDFHSKNIIFSEGRASVIDWVYGTAGNPIEDFVRNIISAESSKHYAAALIDSYYNNNIPEEFWRALAIYTAIHELRITKYSFTEPHLSASFVKHQHALVLQEYSEMKTVVPLYYAK